MFLQMQMLWAFLFLTPMCLPWEVQFFFSCSGKITNHIFVSWLQVLIICLFFVCPAVDVVQLGFLPRKLAKWVSPLWDIGFFRFSAYVRPELVLGAVSGGNNKKVPLSMFVSQVWHFDFSWILLYFLTCGCNLHKLMFRIDICKMHNVGKCRDLILRIYQRSCNLIMLLPFAVLLNQLKGAPAFGDYMR